MFITGGRCFDTFAVGSFCGGVGLLRLVHSDWCRWLSRNILYSTCTVYTTPKSWLVAAYHSAIHPFSPSHTHSVVTSNPTGLSLRLINLSLNDGLTARHLAHLMDYVLMSLGLAT